MNGLKPGFMVIIVIIFCMSWMVYGKDDPRTRVFVEPAGHQADVAMDEGLEKWGYWQLVGDGEDADLIVRLCVSTATWGISTHVRAFVIDAKTKETIWSSKNESGRGKPGIPGVHNNPFTSPYATVVNKIVIDMRKRFGK